MKNMLGKGFKIGCAEDKEAMTGCTVILCEEGAVAGVDVRGGAPGTRETDLLAPGNMIEKIHACVLSGGSAYGLEASTGVMKYLEEGNFGFDVGVCKVPIVCSAVIFDLLVGDAHIRPDMVMGYEACKNATSIIPECGSIGGGCGATVGKARGIAYSTKSGQGYAEYNDYRLWIAVIVIVNAFGEIVDGDEIIAGAYNNDKSSFIQTIDCMKLNSNFPIAQNTTIGAVLTNAKLTKVEARKVAQMAHNGLGKTIRPVHTMYDGDTIFCLSTGEVESDVNLVGAIAVGIVEKAVKNAVINIQGEI